MPLRPAPRRKQAPPRPPRQQPGGNIKRGNIDIALDRLFDDLASLLTASGFSWDSLRGLSPQEQMQHASKAWNSLPSDQVERAFQKVERRIGPEEFAAIGPKFESKLLIWLMKAAANGGFQAPNSRSETPKPEQMLDWWIEVSVESSLTETGFPWVSLDALNPKEAAQRITRAWNALSREQKARAVEMGQSLFGPERFAMIWPDLEPRIGEHFIKARIKASIEKGNFPSSQAPASSSIELPKPQNHVQQQMAPQDQSIIIKPDGTLVKGGVSYRSLLAAAPDAQVHSTTLLRWIKNPKFKLEGRPIQTYYFAQAHTHFISEESVQRMAKRFIKWPSQEPAGLLTLGETDDRSGYLRMSEAADIARVSKQTMFLWASQDKAPTDMPLDVIKCTASGHFYIREKDAYDLRKLVPRSGLHPGRRPQLVPQPA